MKISSIIRGIVKNHAFRDGNKRTAVLVYYSLCDRNKVTPKNSHDMFSIIIDIAKSNYTLEQVKDKLF
jgi:death-on-curing family protein